ncbi:cisplatin damage response ATP-dependent DNA ligase [Rhodovulum sp. DZ06]|uniref:cisplatin damage response ATP-dependent DNA ligase n=1 Tax=Rhodovulum sp. DZ06 TaxID=3425126 RepID=UPI003D32F3DE
MNRFADLLEALVFTPSRNGKLRLLEAYFRETPDPDRGWALGALSGGLDLPAITPSLIRRMAEARTDPTLFALSHDFVGDLAETAALIWPEGAAPAPDPAAADPAPTLPGLFPDEEAALAPLPDADPPLSAVVARLRALPPSAAPARREAALAALFDRLSASARFALIKLCTGGLRVGVSAAMTRAALARLGAPTAEDIEAVWHGQEAPYTGLFAWIEGGPPPKVDAELAFRPMMLANPLEPADRAGMDPAAHAAEVKWDGIRVQAASAAHGRRLFSRTGEDLSGAFPDLLAALDRHGCVDGELLVEEDGEIAPFAALQTRLNRKAPTRAMLAEKPAVMMVYDLLHDGTEDLRDLPWEARRKALEAWIARPGSERLRLSPVLEAADWDTLEARRAAARGAGEEGLMLKRRDAPYRSGRPAGLWWKWKREPLRFDCVMMYAQRGHGKRSSFFSDYTFGVWDGDALVPVGKAYSGFTDAELAELDKWVRANATDRFGTVRGVKPGLVLEIACDALSEAPKRRGGLSMRFPRVARIRWDKPIAEADRLETLRRAAGLD